jgi:glutaredoxin-related protein
MHACGVSRNVVSILQKTHYKDMVSVEVEQIGVTS